MKTMLVFFILVSAFCGAGYFYYTDTQERIGQLRENNVRLEAANKSNLETIKQMQEDAIRMQKANEELAMAKQSAERKVAKLQNVFSDLNLDKQALEDPNVTEEKINNGTKKVLQRIRDLTTTE
jgi:cell division protein FtsB